MNTKIKLITIVLMTLAVVAGGTLYLYNQLAGVALFTSNNSGDIESWVSTTETAKSASIIPSTSKEQVAAYNMNRPKVDRVEMTDLHSDVVMSTESSLKSAADKNKTVYVGVRPRRDDIMRSSGGSSSSGEMMAYGGRRSSNRSDGGDGYASNSSILGGGSGALLVPKPYTPGNDWALIDPEPTDAKQEDQILPVGNGVYVLSLLALLYGGLIFIRRRL